MHQTTIVTLALVASMFCSCAGQADLISQSEPQKGSYSAGLPNTKLYISEGSKRKRIKDGAEVRLRTKVDTTFHPYILELVSDSGMYLSVVRYHLDSIPMDAESVGGTSQYFTWRTLRKDTIVFVRYSAVGTLEYRNKVNAKGNWAVMVGLVGTEMALLPVLLFPMEDGYSNSELRAMAVLVPVGTAMTWLAFRRMKRLTMYPQYDMKLWRFIVKR